MFKYFCNLLQETGQNERKKTRDTIPRRQNQRHKIQKPDSTSR